MYSFHMPLFFMLAGYIQGMREPFSGGGSYSRYFWRNFFDLYIPCMFFSYLQAFLNFAFFSSSNSLSVHLPSLYHILTIPFLGFLNYWFLSALFFVKCIHLVFECFVKREGINSTFWIILFILINFTGLKLPVFVTRFSLGLYFHSGYIIKRRNFYTD